MVKLQFSKTKKKYMGGKNVYVYGKISLHFPRSVHELLIPLRHRNLKIEVSKNGKITNITLTEQDDV